MVPCSRPFTDGQAFVRFEGRKTGEGLKPCAIWFALPKMVMTSGLPLTDRGDLAKPGALLLTKLTKAPILLLSFEFGSSIKLKSWDEFVIPLPFSKVRAVTRLLDYDETFDGRTIEEATRFVEEKLVELTKD